MQYQLIKILSQHYKYFLKRFAKTTNKFLQISLVLLPFQLITIHNLNVLKRIYTSTKLPQVFITPTTKNSTSSASPMACTAPWILTMTFQIVPPLKVSGDCVINCQISANLLFHVSRVFSRFCTTQLSDKRFPPFAHVGPSRPARPARMLHILPIYCPGRAKCGSRRTHRPQNTFLQRD